MFICKTNTSNPMIEANIIIIIQELKEFIRVVLEDKELRKLANKE